MKPIDSRRYPLRDLAIRLRNVLGVQVYYSELARVLVPSPGPTLAKLVTKKLARVEEKVVGGKTRRLVTFAEPYGHRHLRKAKVSYPGQRPLKRQRRYPVAVRVVWILGQDLKDAKSNRTPRVDVVSFLKLGAQVELVRYVGRIPGGWRVQPA